MLYSHLTDIYSVITVTDQISFATLCK